MTMIQSVVCAEKKDEADISSVQSKEGNTKKSSKKAKQLRVLDGKLAQSLSILLGSVRLLRPTHLS